MLARPLEHLGLVAWYLDAAKPEAGKWYRLETTFIAPTDQAALHLYSGQNATVWFNDFSIVPVE